MTKSRPNWSAAKAELAHFDRTALVGLVKDLFALSPDNSAFIAARLGLGADPLDPYRKTISRWIRPDLVRGQDVSVAKAKKAISDYRKAIGKAEGVAELSVFYCEEAARLLSDCGMEDEGYFNALVRMYGQALTYVTQLTEPVRTLLLARLDMVRTSLRDIGWGVGDAITELWIEHAAVE